MESDIGYAGYMRSLGADVCKEIYAHKNNEHLNIRTRAVRVYGSLAEMTQLGST